MAERLGSYRQVGSGGSSTWIENWKKNGFLVCVPHREPPYVRSVHNFRRVQTVEGKDGVKTLLKWFPWVCWESQENQKKQRFDGAHAKVCPAHMLIDHLAQRTDLPSDAIVFRWKAGREGREVLKVDFIGKGEGKTAWQDDFTSVTEFVISLIVPEQVLKGVQLSNEKWSLGKEFKSRIDKDCQQLGDEEGDPEKKPILYSFEYNDETRKYGVSRHGNQKLITPEIRKLWEDPAPDASRYVDPSNPHKLLAAVRDAIQVDGVPLDEIFAPSIAIWDEQHPGEKNEEEDEKDPWDEDATKLADEVKAKANGAQKAKGKNGHKAEPPPAKEESAPEPPKETAPTRPARQVKKPSNVVPLKPDVRKCGLCKSDWADGAEKCTNPKCGGITSSCGVCEKGWRDDEPACPHCGAMPAEPDPAPQPRIP